MKDVGRKTSIRVVNSQVVAKPQFKFLESKEIHIFIHFHSFSFRFKGFILSLTIKHYRRPGGGGFIFGPFQSCIFSNSTGKQSSNFEQIATITKI